MIVYFFKNSFNNLKFLLMKKFTHSKNYGIKTRQLFGIVLVFFAMLSISTVSNAQCQISADNHIHVVLSDDNCDATLMQEMFLSNDGSNCTVADHFEFEVKDMAGNVLIAMTPNAVVDASYIGGTYNLKIEAHDNLHTVLSAVTLTFDVADNTPPTIDCPPTIDTVNIQCYQQDTYVLPISDNCSGVDSVLINEVITDNDCSVLQGMPATVFRRIDRTYVAIDSSGNHSAPCTVHFQVNRLTDTEFATMIRFPEDKVKAHQNAIQCSDADDYKDTNGNFDPNKTGWPYLVYPDQNLTAAEIAAGNVTDTAVLNNSCTFSCNLASTYVDVKVNTCPECIEKVVRFWTVVESSCQYPERFYPNIQTIEIVDTINPTIILPANTQTTTNVSGNFPNDSNGNPVSCGAIYTFPQPEMSDLCTPNSSLVYTISVVNDAGTPVLFADTTETKSTVTRALPIGVNDITYTVYDKCGNSTSNSYELEIVDLTRPIAVCIQKTTVSLGSDGKAYLYAPVLNSGSHDECCAVNDFKVKRMNDAAFADIVEFDCGDVPLGTNDPQTVQVILRVTDNSGNFNDCMVEVEVQDKIPSTIECPQSIAVQCDYPYDENNLSKYFGKVVKQDEVRKTYHTGANYKGVDANANGYTWSNAVLNYSFQDGVANDNCLYNLNPQEVIDNTYPIFDIAQCGNGYIERKFKSDDAGTATCTQTIWFVRDNQFSEDDIDWPSNITKESSDCKALSEYTPEKLNSSPVIHEGSCDIVGLTGNLLMNHHDDVTYLNGDETAKGCFIINRSWKVTDLCQVYTAGPNKGLNRFWNKTQIIKVLNTVDPVFTTDCATSEASSFDNCDGAKIDLTMSATDDCTDDDKLLWRYQIDYNGNGTWDIDSNDSNNNSTIQGGSATVPADITHPFGTHDIVWTVWDQCGNQKQCLTTFTIKNKVPPSVGPVCGGAFIIVLDGAPVCSKEQSAEDLGPCLHAEYSCDPNAELVYTFDAPMPNGLASKTYDCSHVADDQAEHLYVSVIVDGEWVYNSAQITIDVQSNDPNCGCPAESGNLVNGIVSGKLTNLSNVPIEGTKVQLIGNEVESISTNVDGEFAFTPTALNKSYKVRPISADDYVNGVSTLDLVQIQKHLLNIKKISSPYSIIASDANNDHKISASDILMLRKVILGSSEEFTNNSSWRYISKDYDFANVKNPLNGDYDYRIEELAGDMAIDFIAIKVGDINGDATINGNVVESRSAESIVFDIENREYTANETVEIPVYAKDFNSVQG